MDASLTVLNNFVSTGIVPLISAGVGGYVGAYLKRKAERRATSEDFRKVLEEQLETTFETERVKTAIASAAATSLETVKTDLQQRLSSMTFLRERATSMKDMIFEAAIALDTLVENCHSISWVTKTSLEDIHERGHSAIARIDYALAQLREMHVVDNRKTTATALLGDNFRKFAGAVAVLKDEIALGNIGPDGPVNDTARNANSNLNEKSAVWRSRLKDVRELVAWLAIAPEPSLTHTVAATGSS